MTREPRYFSSLKEARESQEFDEFTVFKNPYPVRVIGNLASRSKGRRFVQVASAMAVATAPPRPVVFVGSKGRGVVMIPSRDAIPMSCHL